MKVERRPSARQKSPPSRVASNRQLVLAAVVVLAVVAWFAWPSPFGRVANLASGGSAIVAFGDSLTAGYGAGPGEDYPSRLTTLTGSAVINAGISGDTTGSALERLPSDALEKDPRVVIVGLGGNDFLRGVPIATTEANLRAIIGRIQERGAMVVLLGFRFPSLTANYEGMYERVAEDSRSLLIPDLLDGILRDPSLKSDDIHPNGRGYQLMAERVAGPLGKLVKKADAAR